MPFLWFHDQKNPIGEVFAADVRPEGIYIKARVSKVTKPSRLKTLVDEAWSAFTAQPPLVRGLSIGWGALESAPLAGRAHQVQQVDLGRALGRHRADEHRRHDSQREVD